MLKNKKILVTGATGFLGHHVCEVLASRGLSFESPPHQQYDLTDHAEVRKMFQGLRPHVVFHVAGYVGGILANKQYPADFFYQNLMMNTMVLHEAYKAGVEKLISLIGGCSYPAQAPNPIREESLWEGYPQMESAAYSVAKKMLVVQSEAYRRQFDLNGIVLVPGNIYGPHDNFNLTNAHVIPALIRKVFEAKRTGKKRFEVWGSGKPVRDFIYAQDAAEGIVLAAEAYDGDEIINISSGQPTSIRELVETIVKLTGFEGDLFWDASKPDGQMFKLFDVTRMRTILNYDPPTSLNEGLKITIDWFAKNYQSARL